MQKHRTRCSAAAIMAFAVGALVHGNAFAYTLNNLGAAGGWDDVNKSASITTVIDGSDYTADLDSAGITASLMNGYNAWDEIAGASNLNFSYLADENGNYDAFDGPDDSAGPNWFDGQSSSLDQAAHFRYANIVVGGWLPEDYFTNIDPVGGANILAVTWTGKLSGDGARKPTWHSEIFFNDGWKWGVGCADFTCIDIETVFAHELGHALGFGHEDSLPSIMASYYAGPYSGLYQTDIDGAIALYANGAGGGGGGSKGKKGGRPNAIGADHFEVQVAEPATLAMFGFGLAGFGYVRRRRAV